MPEKKSGKIIKMDKKVEMPCPSKKMKKMKKK